MQVPKLKYLQSVLTNDVKYDEEILMCIGLAKSDVQNMKYDVQFIKI